MLALVMAMALAQCTKDTDCKGNRVCTVGECVEAAPVLTPQPSVLERASTISRAHELRGEIADLKVELADASLVSPIIKLAAAAILAGVAVGTALYYQRSLRFGPDLGPGYQSVPITVAIIGGGLSLWGGLQLGLRLRSRARLPEEIRVREEQLAVLEGQR